MNRLAAAVALLVVACSSSSSPPDPTKAKCAPHWKMEMECAGPEMQKALVTVGDMCQKVLNGKNREFFGPQAERDMEAELRCAVESPDCKTYAICKAAIREE